MNAISIKYCEEDLMRHYDQIRRNAFNVKGLRSLLENV